MMSFWTPIAPRIHRKTDTNGNQPKPTKTNGNQPKRTKTTVFGSPRGEPKGGTGNGFSVSQPGDPHRGGSADLHYNYKLVSPGI